MKIVKSSSSSKRKVRTCTFSPQVNIKNKRTAVQTGQNVNAAHSEAKLQDLINDIKSNIYTKVKAVATSPEFGFDENEVDDYFFVETSATEIGEDHHEAIRVEVRGEVSYEGLEDLMEALNPIIESYDSYAYFEPVEPGIIEAYVSVNQIDMSIYGATASLDHMFYDYHGKRFSVHDNSSEIGEDSIDDVYFLWKGSISQQAGAYNDADEDYVYAFIRGRGVIEYYKKGKYVATDNYTLRDEDDFEYAWEYMEIILQHICDRLIAYNKDVPDRMIHNSTSIQAADNEFHGYADVASDIESALKDGIHQFFQSDKYNWSDDQIQDKTVVDVAWAVLRDDKGVERHSLIIDVYAEANRRTITKLGKLLDKQVLSKYESFDKFVWVDQYSIEGIVYLDIFSEDINSSTSIESSDSYKYNEVNYEFVTNIDGYWVYRAVVDGKGTWRAMPQGSDESEFSRLSFPISYEQARGFEPINEPSAITKLRKDLGKKLLPKSGQSVEATEDLTDLPENFQHAYTLAKNDFMNDYSSSGVEVYIVPDDFNAEDGEICLIVKGINRVGKPTQGKVYVYLDEEDPDVIYTALEETADALSIEPGSADIEMSICSDNIEASAQDIWVQDANGYVICRTDVSGRDAGWPSYYDRTDGKFTLGWVVDIDCMYDTYEEAAKDLEQLKARIKKEYEEDPSPRKSKVALRADYTILEVIDGEIQSDRPGNPDIIVDWRRENTSSNVTSSTDDKVFIEDIIDGLEDNGYDLDNLHSIKEGLWALFGYQGKEVDEVIEDLVAGGFVDSNVLIDACDNIYSNSKEYKTSETYRGRRIRLLNDGTGYAIFEKGEMIDYGFKSLEDAEAAIDEYDNMYQDDVQVYSDTEEDVEDLPMVDQEYDSAATSINSNKLPAIYKMVNFNQGDVVVDFGGGKFDNAVEYIRDKGATLVVYDPYNRSAEHNREVLRILRENGGADAAVNSNVLNVIKEPEARKNVLENIARITKPGAPIYITVYEGKGDGQEGPTKSGYQLNRKTADYLEEIQEVFPDATRRGKLITAHNSGVSAATNITNIGAKITCSDEYDTTWIKLAQKQVPDSDGFYTDYTMYISDDGTSYIFMFGDEDIYGPDPQYADYECSDWNEASEWWNDYNGSEVDDITSSTILDVNPEFRNNFEEAIDFFYESYPATVELTDEVDEDYDTLYKAYVKETGSLYQQTPGIVYIDINWDSGEILQALQETAEAIGIEQYPDNIESSESVEGDAFSQLEDAYLSPPEYDDPIEHEDSQELIEVELDQVITVDVDGDYEWDDDTYVWASPDGSNEEWRSEDGVYIDDKVGVVEHIDDLIIPNVPTRPGKYRITGLAELIYDVSGIQEYRTEYSPDDYESDLDTDHAVVSFDFSKSTVENLKITPVRR